MRMACLEFVKSRELSVWCCSSVAACQSFRSKHGKSAGTVGNDCDRWRGLLDDGLLRVRLTVKEPVATLDGASAAVTVAICTSFGFIGDAEHKRTGIPLISGAALSIL